MHRDRLSRQKSGWVEESNLHVNYNGNAGNTEQRRTPVLGIASANLPHTRRFTQSKARNHTSCNHLLSDSYGGGLEESRHHSPGLTKFVLPLLIFGESTRNTVSSRYTDISETTPLLPSSEDSFQVTSMFLTPMHSSALR